MQIEQDRKTFYKPKWEIKPKIQPHPAKRWCHTTALYGSNLYIMGGRVAESAKMKEFVYRVNCQTFSCEPINLTDSMMRESHSCVLVKDSMYVMFGINKAFEVLNDCLNLKISSNSLVCEKKKQNPQIAPRESHMSIVLEERYILIYGGMNSEQIMISQFHLFDIEKQTWRRIQKIEGTIQGKVGGTLINIKNQIYLFGGQINDQNQYSNQIYKIQINNFRQNQSEGSPQIIITKLNVTGPRPLPRSQFASVSFRDQYLIVLGGQGPNNGKSESAKLLNDIWAFDVEKMIWEEIIVENPNIFKPRSSFTANIYKDSLIVFGGLVAFKDFKSTDEIFVLNLNTEIQSKPLCNLCRSSYKIIPKQEIEVQNTKAVKNGIYFATSFSTISAIANTIQNPFIALSTLLHSFDYFEVDRCAISLDSQKLIITLKNMPLTIDEWKYILDSYDFIPLIQQRDQRVKRALNSQIRQNKINYLSYNIKNCCLRLGNEMLISWVNEKKELQICLINKFGVYNTMNSNRNNQLKFSQTSIILQHLKECNINVLDLYSNSMTLCITSLKNSFYREKQIFYSIDAHDIICGQIKLKQYLSTAFSRGLTYSLAIFSETDQFTQDKFFKLGQNQIDKWPQQNSYQDLFQEILTFDTNEMSKILVYQNNKLMHQKQIDMSPPTVYEFHLTKNISPNITFSDVIPSQQLLNAIKSVIKQLSDQISKSLKRNKSTERQQTIVNLVQLRQQQTKEGQPQLRKIVKTNDKQVGEVQESIILNNNFIKVSIADQRDKV